MSVDQLLWHDRNADFQAGLVGVSGSQLQRLQAYLAANGGLRIRTVSVKTMGGMGGMGVVWEFISYLCF